VLHEQRAEYGEQIVATLSPIGLRVDVNGSDNGCKYQKLPTFEPRFEFLHLVFHDDDVNKARHRRFKAARPPTHWLKFVETLYLDRRQARFSRI